jgi:hypothetical protein
MMETPHAAVAQSVSQSRQSILQTRNQQKNPLGWQDLPKSSVCRRLKLERESNAKENRYVCDTKTISELDFRIKEEADAGGKKNLGLEPQLKVLLPTIRLQQDTLSSTLFSAAYEMSMIPSNTNWQKQLWMSSVLNKAIQKFVAMRRIQGIRKPVMNNRTTLINKRLLDLGTSRIDDAGCWGAWTYIDDMDGIKVEHKEKEWAEDLLYQDSKYGWFVPRRPSHLRWSWSR